jgi:hypothetical protein
MLGRRRARQQVGCDWSEVGGVCHSVRVLRRCCREHQRGGEEEGQSLGGRGEDGGRGCEMAAAYPLKAPLDVSVGIGKSWNQAAH